MTKTVKAINVTTPARMTEGDLNNIAKSDAIHNLAAVRSNVVNIAGKTGEVLKAYAAGLCQAFNLVDNEGNITTAWYDLKGKLKAGVNAEFEEFKKAMTAAGHEGNVYEYWKRVKQFSGYQTAGQRAKGNETLEAKTVADLKTIINRIFKAEESGEESKASEVKGLLMDAFEQLGGDVMTLG